MSLEQHPLRHSVNNFQRVQMNRNFCIFSLLLLGLVKTLYAADPVSWTLTPATGFSPTQVGHQSQVTYTLTNNLPFPTLIVTDYRFTESGFSTFDACKNTTLPPRGSCQITFTFTPHDPGPATVQLSYGYHNNRIALPVLRAVGNPAPIGAVTGSIFGLPSVITLNPLQQPDFITTFRNTSEVPVTGYAVNGSGSFLFEVSPPIATVTALSNTCGTFAAPVTLQPHEDCQISAQLTPLAVGPFTLNAYFIYNVASVAQASAAATIIQGGGGCTVHGQTELPLPTTTYQYADNLVRFVFENECTSSAISLGQVMVSTTFIPNAGQSAITTVSPLYDTCSGQILPAQGNCFVLASVVPQNPAPQMTITASVVAGGVTSTVSTSAPVSGNNLIPQHVVHLINQCPFNVWYGIANGRGVGSPDPTPGSQSPGGAPAASYFLPEQQSGQAPSKIDLVLLEYVNGAVWGRTGCASDGANFVCGTGMCNTVSPTSGTCVPSGSSLDQPVPPYTKFEFNATFVPSTDGVYDVSLINGFNVPVEIKGLGPTSMIDPFQCTGAGAPIQSDTDLGSCSWQFNPAFSGLTVQDFVYVTPGAATNCTSDADCTGGEICGMAFDSLPANTPLNRRCGQFIGYSTLANYFGYPSPAQWGSPLFNLYAKYDIGVPMTAISSQNYGTGAIFGNLVACIPTDNNSANTCYNPASATVTCCGCVNWESSAVPTATSDPCLNFNPDWLATQGTTASILQAIIWLKQACPTAYSYQFDDPSSSFTCNPSPSARTDYQITYCPGGLSSLPVGAVDGR
jgi:hypothetical protein